MPHEVLTRCKLCIVGAVLAALFLFWWAQPNPDFPPGPIGIPIFGILPFLRQNPEQYFCTWSKKLYGAVMSVRIGSKPIVILNSYNVIKQAFHDEADVFTGQPSKRQNEDIWEKHNLVTKDFRSNLTLINQFTKEVLTDFASGKEGMENLNEEIQYFLENLKRSGSKPVGLRRHLLLVLTNMMTRITCGHSYDYSDPEFVAVIDAISKKMKPLNPLLAATFKYVPLLKYLPYIRDLNETSLDPERKLRDSISSILNRKKTNRKISRGTIDAFYEQQKVVKSPNFSDKQLQLLVRDIFIAGVESTVVHIQSSLLALLTSQKHYKKIVFEIDSLKASGGITIEHLDSLPYTRAFLAEVFRVTTSPPFSLKHRLTTATNLSGYHLPEGTEVMANLWAANRDPDVWSSPDVFDPRRHLNIDGKFNHSGKLLNFGIGPRSCPGKELAQKVVFLVFSNMLRAFTITSSTGDEPPYRNSNELLPFQVVLIETYSTGS